MNKQNTFYGYEVGDEFHWYKSKQTVKKHLKGTKKQFHRATKVKGEMYINLTYLTLNKW